MFLTFCSEEERKLFEESRSDMGTVLYKLFSYLYTISLSHSSGVVNTVFRFVSFRMRSLPLNIASVKHSWLNTHSAEQVERKI